MKPIRIWAIKQSCDIGINLSHLHKSLEDAMEVSKNWFSHDKDHRIVELEIRPLKKKPRGKK